jgi:hypothetical protein
VDLTLSRLKIIYNSISCNINIDIIAQYYGYPDGQGSPYGFSGLWFRQLRNHDSAFKAGD